MVGSDLFLVPFEGTFVHFRGGIYTWLYPFGDFLLHATILTFQQGASGTIFGEMALQNDKSRAATIESKSSDREFPLEF